MFLYIFSLYRIARSYTLDVHTNYFTMLSIAFTR